MLCRAVFLCDFCHMNRLNMKYHITVLAIMVAVFSSCSHSGHTVPPGHDEVNSVYYWKTVFQLDSDDRAFIARHDIGRIYLRMFDVSENGEALSHKDSTVPNASVRVDDDSYRLLRDSLADMEFVPVVYITLDALKEMSGHEGLLASNIVTRVRNMCEYNGLPNVRELQLDCDWTASTERSYFLLCDSVKLSMAELLLPWRLSSTIRLHQLARPVPPVHNGVLMVYNTGSFNNPDACNSIIDVDDVEPYLKYLSGYPLHLDVAYPTYSWQLLFRNRQFIGLMNGLELTDSTLFRSVGAEKYVVVRDFLYRDRLIREGDMVRSEVSGAEEVLK